MAIDKSLKDMTFEDYCRTVFNTQKRFDKPEVLKGIRCVSTTQYILGPSCAAYLAELGAETIKVELPKRGEPMRHTTPFNEPFLYPLSRWMPDKGTGLGFFGANPNEYFLSLDFHKPEAIQIMKRLAAKTDVFAENYRAGTFDRWGIGYRQHAQVNPRVIYQWMGGFGGWGPGRNRASYDILGQAQGGCFSVTGWHKEYGGMPSKQTIWIMDYWGGAISAFNVLACLYWRDNVSGKGNFLEYSQVHGAQRHLTDFISLYGKTGIVPQRFGNFEPLLCVHGILKCGKSSYPNSKNPQEQEVGFCLVSAYKDEDFQKLCKMINRADLAKKYPTHADRVGADAQSAIYPELEKFAADKTKEEVDKLCKANGILSQPVLNSKEVAANEHWHMRGTLQWLDDRRAATHMLTRRIGLNELQEWALDEKGRFSQMENCFFSIVGLKVASETREVRSWCQPIIENSAAGVIGLLLRNGTRGIELLMQAKAEVGNRNTVQLGPTVQFTQENYEGSTKLKKPFLYQDFSAPESFRLIHESRQTEEGARFYREYHLHRILMLPDAADLPLPPDYRWLPLEQVVFLLHLGEQVNSCARSILSCLLVTEIA